MLYDFHSGARRPSGHGLSAEKLPVPKGGDGTAAIEVASGTNGDYIKWVDFNITYEALNTAYNLDVASYDSPVHLNWIELLAYAGAKSGGSFEKGSVSRIEKLASELSAGETTMEELTKDMDYYEYYYEAYEAVLGGMVGEYEIEKEDDKGGKSWKKVYGLKAFSLLPKVLSIAIMMISVLPGAMVIKDSTLDMI